MDSLTPDEVAARVKDRKPFSSNGPALCSAWWQDDRYMVEYWIKNWFFFVYDAGTWYENADTHNENADYVQQYIHPGAETIKMGYFPLFILADKGMAAYMQRKLTGEIA